MVSPGLCLEAALAAWSGQAVFCDPVAKLRIFADEPPFARFGVIPAIMPRAFYEKSHLCLLKLLPLPASFWETGAIAISKINFTQFKCYVSQVKDRYYELFVLLIRTIDHGPVGGHVCLRADY